MPVRAVQMVPATDSTIQLMPTRRAAGASAGERRAMKRTMMCGCPK